MTENSPPNSPSSNRRASFAPGQRISELFRQSSQANPSSNSSNGNNAASTPSAYPGPIATAAAQANQRRRMSISALGLSGSPTGQNGSGVGIFGGGGRRGSMTSNGTPPSAGTSSPGGASTNSGTADESAIEDGDGMSDKMGFARRMSFGARAMRNASNGASSLNASRFPVSENKEEEQGADAGSAAASLPSSGWRGSMSRGLSAIPSWKRVCGRSRRVGVCCKND